MYKIKTMNHISPYGLQKLEERGCVVGEDIQAPDGLILRSADLHSYAFEPSLIAIARSGAGTNNIPLEDCCRRGIVVFNSPGANAEAVKEQILCSLVLSSRDVLGSIDWVKGLNGRGKDIPALVEKGKSQFAGPELMGKTLGVIGLGAIGRKVASIAQAFGCRVIYYSTSGAHDDPDYERVDLYRLLKDSDVVSIHAPLNEATENLMNIETFANMKRNAILINVGRGSIVNERDLCCALREGLIAGAALDVLSSEPIRSDSPLLKMADDDRLYITPHIAWASKEARTRLIGLVQKNIASYLEGGMENRVV